MSDQHGPLTDDAIERGLALRAPHDADPTLLDSIVAAAARTPQVRSWMPTALSHGAPSVRLAWIAIILGLVLAIAVLAVVGGGPRPPDLAVVVSPSPSPSIATPSPSMSSSSGPCVTDIVEVLTGDALPTAEGDTLADLGQGRGVYLAGRPPRLWAVGPGRASARLIASFEPELGILDVLDISPDGSDALVRAGDISPSGFVPECADLYVVRTDGSGATRLTTFGAGRFVAGGAFSPDGSRVAFAWWDPGTVTVLDLGNSQTVAQGCDVAYSNFPVQIDWAPSGDRIAVDCNGALTIFDPTGATTPVEPGSEEATLAFLWAADREILVARAPGGNGTGAAHIDSFDVVSRASTVLARLDDPDIEADQSIGFSPDGHWLVFRGRERGSTDPGGDYVVSTTGGTAVRILVELKGDSPVSWSGDSRALTYVDQTLTLTRLEVETRRRSTLGTLRDYVQGVWRIP
jgi:hypothetical protein